MSEPVLDVVEPDAAARAVALVLHGGRARSTGPVRARQLAVVRMTPFAVALHRAGRAHGLAVARLRYQVRGWNGDRRSPVADVEWALGRLRERFGELPASLIGHSMGGRAAIYAAGDESVTSVVGLAPWIEPGDPYRQVAGKHVLVAHGALDRMTNPSASAMWTRSAASVAASASYVSIRRERHAMLRRARLWHSLTADYVVAVMCGVQPEESGDAFGANVIGKVLAGQPSLVV